MVILNSRDTSKRALLRAGEIKARKKRNLRLAKNATVIFGACAVISFALIISPITSLPMFRGTVMIDDGRVPLAGAPLQTDVNARPYAPAEPVIMPGSGIMGYHGVLDADGAFSVGMLLCNPEDNPYYLTFEIVLTDTGESVYMSGMVEPGLCIKNPILSGPLTEGSHRVVLTVRSYDLYGHAPVSKANVEFYIIAGR